MKEFEKWRHNSIARPITQETFIAFEIGWQAALKMLYNKLDYSEGDKRIKDIIEQELEEE